jgi:hypothetical protein
MLSEPGGRPVLPSYRCQCPAGYPQIVFLFPMWITPVDNSVGSAGQRWAELPESRRRGYFHCVETPNPAAMKPKPTTMFQLPSESMGSEPSVT